MEEKNNFTMGVLGAFLGGMIATLPWILCYVYANMMYSVFTIIVGMGALKGYQIMKGKVDKKLPFIIGIVSFICITLATLVIIPNLLLIQEVGKTSVEMFKLLYSTPEFKEAILQDYAYTVLFTIIGCGGIISTINKQVKNGETTIDLKKGTFTPKTEDMEEIKKMFIDRNAVDKDQTINKKEVKAAFKDKRDTLNFLISKGIIVSMKDGYYYSEQNDLHSAN